MITEQNLNVKREELVVGENQQNVEEEEECLDDPEALAYLNHLLNDGANEAILPVSKMEMPPWYNESLFIAGQKYMQKYRFLMVSGMMTGLIAILAIPSILRILISTGQSSTHTTAYRRYLRTIFHTYAWYRYPPNNPKFWTSLRSVHKAHVKSSFVSEKKEIGIISQKDMALTQFGFIGFYTLGAPRVQLYDDDFMEASVHMWRVLGHLLGIKDEYNLCGRNWKETKPRMEIALRKVFAPALAKEDKDFEHMTTALIDGLWTVNTTLSVGSFLYYTKRLANVPGYQYYDFDYQPGMKRSRTQKEYYYDLNWWDRVSVTTGLHIVTYFHKYAAVRWYLNFRTWLGEQFMYYFPYIAFWKYGIKWSIVRIFRKDGSAIDFE